MLAVIAILEETDGDDDARSAAIASLAEPDE